MLLLLRALCIWLTTKKLGKQLFINGCTILGSFRDIVREDISCTWQSFFYTNYKVPFLDVVFILYKRRTSTSRHKDTRSFENVVLGTEVT